MGVENTKSKSDKSNKFTILSIFYYRIYEEIEHKIEDLNLEEQDLLSNQLEEKNNESIKDVPFLNEVWNGKTDNDNSGIKKHKTMQIMIPNDEDNNTEYNSNSLNSFSSGSHTVKNKRIQNKFVFPNQSQQFKPNTAKINLNANNFYNAFQFYNAGYLNNPQNFNMLYGFQTGINTLPFNPLNVNLFPNTVQNNYTNFGNFIFTQQSFIPQDQSKNFQNNTVLKSPSSNEINLNVIEDILKNKEKRTSLMLNKIPDKYSLQQLLIEIDNQLKIKGNEDRIYDCFYLPMSETKKQRNLGYAFINMVHPLYVIHFYYKFKNFKWTKFNTNKEFSIKFADKQGKSELIKQLSQRYGNEKKPFIFETNKDVLDFKSNDKIKIIVSSKLKSIIEEYQSNILNIFEFIED